MRFTAPLIISLFLQAFYVWRKKGSLGGAGIMIICFLYTLPPRAQPAMNIINEWLRGTSYIICVAAGLRHDLYFILYCCVVIQK